MNDKTFAFVIICVIIIFIFIMTGAAMVTSDTSGLKIISQDCVRERIITPHYPSPEEAIKETYTTVKGMQSK